MSQSVLVLGASGYIGQHLVRALSARGYPVLAAARHIDRLQKLALPGVTCRSVDLNQPQDLPALLTGIDTLYYLVHGMGEGGDFIAHERRGGAGWVGCPGQGPGRPGGIFWLLPGPGAGGAHGPSPQKLVGPMLGAAGVPPQGTTAVLLASS
ncbi:NAD(P)H-binding protein, partial [Klebsiella pneumoniae]|nr:NAD(P)H-binding protein [Klebsiella pneumoniae]